MRTETARIHTRHRVSECQACENDFSPTINWGHGRLRQHQSFLSFATAFCALNHLTPRRFRDYWGKLFAYDHKHFFVSRIAEFLDEPFGVVKTVFETNTSFLGGGVGGKISYCPSCISQGFHGSFHEDLWLKQCLIHGTDLVNEQPVNPSFQCAFDRSVQVLERLLEEKNTIWPVLIEDWSADLLDERNNLVVEYFQWKRAIQNSAQEWLEVSCEVLGPIKNQYLLHPSIWLGRLIWANPISQELSEKLFVQPQLVTPVIHRCNDVLAQELASIFDQVSLAFLLSTYRFANDIENRNPLYRPIVLQAVRAFLKDHSRQKCNCLWGTTKYEPWSRYAPGAIRYWSVLCPYRCAAEELNEEWLPTVSEKKWRSTPELSAYIRNVNSLCEKGLARAVGHTDSPFKVPLLRLTCSAQAIEVFDLLLLELAKSHVDELKHWLISVDGGIPPDSRDYPPPNVYLMQNSRGIDSIVTWPVVTRFDVIEQREVR